MQSAFLSVNAQVVIVRGSFPMTPKTLAGLPEMEKRRGTRPALKKRRFLKREQVGDHCRHRHKLKNNETEGSMGDRANIVIKQHIAHDEVGEIFFYTHWDGCRTPITLQDALKRGRSRWDDESYLARIIFSEMIQGNLKGESGYGISAYLTDNEYDLLVVDAEMQTVTIRKESAEPGEGFPIPFEKFISLDLTNAPWEILQELKEAEGIGD